MNPRILSRPVPVFAALLLGACTHLTAYRDNHEPCPAGAVPSACADRPVQDVTVPSGGSYRIGYIEFDDQGHLFDRRQMDAVINPLIDDASSTDFLIVVFAHGWKHSAQGIPQDDPNISTFKGVLEQLTQTEQQISKLTKSRPRKVVGVYLGWRGLSATWPVVKELTFWDRKSTAHQVGEIGVAEVLMRLESLKDMRRAYLDSMPGKRRNSKAASCDEDREDERSRLVVVGHSFGGAIVFSALAQRFEERFINTACGPLQASRVRGFGDLAVLVNPAFEAMKFSTLSDMAYERHFYPPTQLPVLAVLTSEADGATGKIFPLGRWFSTLFEKERVYERRRGDGATQRVSEKSANRQTVGHFEPYRTHVLQPEGKLPKPVQGLSDVELLAATVQLLQGWRSDSGQTGSLRFGPLKFERGIHGSPRNPYLVTRVSGELIADHNDLGNPLMLDFIRGLILLKSQPEESLRAYSQYLLKR
ncbi:esterase [Solimonas sp. K1W22B-7]|uniref:esterase n=1 Tax=Solimonas sp. K1W22B-7 TaxID=2303331 RepID=UPI000E32DBE5|nr:esterase [Solimonas sp. K1W22B-7]AXQ27866.1 esterase [Solimonas sp. K1W22B-7]